MTTFKKISKFLSGVENVNGIYIFGLYCCYFSIVWSSLLLFINLDFTLIVGVFVQEEYFYSYELFYWI